MGLTVRIWLAVALAAASLQLGCGEDTSTPTPASQVDTDGDGHPASADCNDTDARVWRKLKAWPDEDRDGVGAGSQQSACVGADTGGWASKEGDCAPLDAARWLAVEGMYPDLDGDGATGPGPVTACVGSTSDLVEHYRPTAGTPDCDDHDPKAQQPAQVWRDVDGDGVGTGEPETWCAAPGRNPPAGYALAGGDCAPGDPARKVMRPYAYRDADGDGFTAASVGEVCSGSVLPTGYALGATGDDCDDANPARTTLTSVYVDSDGDGYGEGQAQLRCIGSQPDLGYASRGEDCAPQDSTRWAWNSYSYRDADGDGVTKAETGVVCTNGGLPSGYAWWPSGNDCDDSKASVFRLLSVYPDTDGDGVGSGSVVSLCAGDQTPAGHATTSTDCAPEDNTAWKTVTYPYRDADGDTFTVPSESTLCVGASTPAGYSLQERGLDCDDSSAAVYQWVSAYADGDADGVGAGSATQLCTDGKVPAPWSSSGTDCAAEDASRWQQLSYRYVDADGDGATVPVQAGSVCSGATLPAPYLATATGNDCDDTTPALFRWAVLYSDRDGDGVGAPPRQVTCIGESVPDGLSLYGDDSDDSDPGQHGDPEDDALLELLLDV